MIQMLTGVSRGRLQTDLPKWATHAAFGVFIPVRAVFLHAVHQTGNGANALQMQAKGQLQGLKLPQQPYTALHAALQRLQTSLTFQAALVAPSRCGRLCKRTDSELD